MEEYKKRKCELQTNGNCLKMTALMMIPTGPLT